MKNTILFFAFILSLLSCTGQSEQQVNNLKTFAKTYGYVKYFHPSDEAASIDWANFAIYGAAQIEQCESEEEVVETLKELFQPIAPSAVFQRTNTLAKYDASILKPEDTRNYELTYWQHKGVSKGMMNKGRPYESVRVNRMSKTSHADPIGNVMTAIDGTKFRGKEIKYSGWVKLNEGSKGTGHLWFRVDKTDKTMGFFDNMGNNPIKENQWKYYEIIGQVDSTANSLVFGCFLQGKGKLFLDKIQLAYKEGNGWVEIPIKNTDFEVEDLGSKKGAGQWWAKGNGYAIKRQNEDIYEGEQSVVIDYIGNSTEKKGKPIFDYHPAFGEVIAKRIGTNISCQIPMVLYANDKNTYPISNEETVASLQGEIEKCSTEPTNLSFRLGNVINTYNVFQHFYPYFDVVDVDWDKELEKALLRCYSDKTEKDHIITLQKLTATLKDGHIRVSSGKMETFAPPVLWEWVEDKLILTQVFDEVITLKPGDEVTHVNDRTAKDYFKEVNSRISAGTQGWLNYRAKEASLMGSKGSTLQLTVKDKKIILTRDKDFYREVRPMIPKKEDYKQINSEVFYLNLDTTPMETIQGLLPELTKYKSIICDMRGYPKGNHELVSHLLKSKDTTEGWMQVPKIVYPDQEKVVDYEKYDWMMKTKRPYLGDKRIIFIIDGRAISYAESYMGYIEGYKLATIVGQPTAGTNGNVNPFILPGGYRISWTGMKVVKHDGSQHHGIGVLPDVYVDKTIEGVIAGRDEFLEKAIELANE